MNINNIDLNIILNYILNINNIEINKLESISYITQNIQRNKDFLDWKVIEKIFYKNKIKIFKNKLSYKEVLEIASYVAPCITYVDSMGWIALTGQKGPLVRVTFLGSEIKTKIFLVNKLASIIPQDTFWITAEPLNSFSGDIKKTDTPGYHLRIFNLLRIENEDIKILIIYSIAIVVLSLVVPVGTQSLINVLSFGTQFQPVWILTVLVTVLLGLAGFLRILQTEVGEILQQKLFIRLVTELNEKLVKIKHEYIEQKKIEETVNYFLDISIIQKSVTVLLVDALSVVLQFFVGILVLVLYHPFFIILDMLLIVSIFFIIFKYMGKNAIKTSIKESKSKYKIVNWFEEIASNNKLFKSSDMISYASARTEILTKMYLENRLDHFKVLIRQIAGLALVQAGGMGIVLGIGGYLVIQGELSLGQLIAAEIIVSKILDGFGKFGKYLDSYYDLVASMDKMGDLLELPLETSGDIPYKKTLLGAKISIKNLEVTDYLDKKINIENFEILSGQKIGIYSIDGDKTELLVKILYGLDMNYKGSIILNDNLSLKEIDLPTWRDAVSYLSDDHLFSGNIYENIKSGKQSVDSDSIRKVLERVGLLKLILENYSNGISKEVTSSGYPIRKQDLFKLNLAKAIAEVPDLLLIENMIDKISNNDKEKLEDILKNELESTTVIIFATNKEALYMCDKIMEI